MAEVKLMQLAQDLEHLGVEVLFFGRKPAGPALEGLLEKQREVVRTADKIGRELAGEIRFNPTRLMGIAYPLDQEIDSITDLLAGLEDIKQCATSSMQELPAKTRRFARLLEGHLMDGTMP
ncbi:MAG: hypothetical protein ACRD3O_03245 [Terriglobia bacterium]